MGKECGEADELKSKRRKLNVDCKQNKKLL